MADEDFPPPVRLMNFVSEEQLAESKKTRGARVEDGTAQRDRPLYEILMENKDKKDAEFNERFKHQPPKALDEDETEFLEKLEMAAVAAKSTIVHEIKEMPLVPKVQELKLIKRKNPPANPLGMIVKIKPQAKKAKMDLVSSVSSLTTATKASNDDKKQPSSDVDNVSKSETEESQRLTKRPSVNADNHEPVTIGGLVSYSDESDDD
ncbi:hypothetical protein H5410_012950 [Solanum commersonii]|uniref:FAM192A/Fyv6 N-terminal domain-containing protein n=1 Tax=Solanum commersonii TaxID=4109 RepID=A0A9J6ATL3_SOLCO|nr:hypothetical protein H5410_012950 [Solanum commersonii]